MIAEQTAKCLLKLLFSKQFMSTLSSHCDVGEDLIVAVSMLSLQSLENFCSSNYIISLLHLFSSNKFFDVKHEFFYQP